MGMYYVQLSFKVHIANDMTIVEHSLLKHSINFCSKITSIIEVFNNVINYLNKVNQLLVLVL